MKKDLNIIYDPHNTLEEQIQEEAEIERQIKDIEELDKILLENSNIDLEKFDLSLLNEEELRFIKEKYKLYPEVEPQEVSWHYLEDL